MARILVIDDEEPIRTKTYMLLIKKGHQVFLAGDGEKGLMMFNRVRPLITILDLLMPGMDGLEVLSRLRTLHPEAFVIMLTGSGTEEVEAKARALGANKFLRKDFTDYELSELIRLTIDRLTRMPSGTAA